MRNRRTRKPNQKQEIKPDQPKKYDQPVLGIFYKNELDIVINITIPFEESYTEAISYKENFEDAVSMIIEDGGFWTTDKCIIPPHRILKFYMVEESAPKKEVKKTPPKQKPKPKSKKGITVETK